MFHTMPVEMFMQHESYAAKWSIKHPHAPLYKAIPSMNTQECIYTALEQITIMSTICIMCHEFTNHNHDKEAKSTSKIY